MRSRCRERPRRGAFFAATDLLLGVAAALYLVTLLLVGLLPKQARQADH
jgi:hypothetical protein